jgi:hypothetical protein
MPANAKPSPTRTINPIHFEDLESHRIEDLIRQLAYDYRNWQNIEATGRLGSGDGIDIRATELFFETWLITLKMKPLVRRKGNYGTGL